MKIKHRVELTDEEVSTLFNLVANPAVITYSTPEAQEIALTEARVEFSNLLQCYVDKAFKFGNRIGKAKADMKDTEMYS